MRMSSCHVGHPTGPSLDGPVHLIELGPVELALSGTSLDATGSITVDGPVHTTGLGPIESVHSGCNRTITIH